LYLRLNFMFKLSTTEHSEENHILFYMTKINKFGRLGSKLMIMEVLNYWLKPRLVLLPIRYLVLV